MCYTDDEDYHGANITVDVPAGTLSQSFVINIIDDDIIESNEILSITIESVSACGFTIGNINTSEITIIDNEGTHVSYMYTYLYHDMHMHIIFLYPSELEDQRNL